MYYQKADGTFVDVKNGGIIIYYLGRGANNNGSTVATPFPPGFRMLSGSPGLRAYDNITMTYGNSTYPPRPISDRVSFACIDYTTSHPETSGFPIKMYCPQGLRAQIQFPTCWDGVNLYKSDQSHVAHLSQIDNGICPPSHPILLPHLFYEAYYNLDSVDTSDGGRFLLATGDTTGYGYHGDFLNGWNMDTQTKAVANCLPGAGSGQISDCPALLASNDDGSQNNCPLQTGWVNETITGNLAALPGCNPPTSGPAAVSQQNCPAQLISHTTSSSPRLVPVINSTTSTLSSGSQAKYAGCFVDGSSGRAMSGATYSDSSQMSTQQCGNFCQAKGFTYFGTEYSAECYCSNTMPTLNASQADCNMVCKGDLTSYCGGPNRLSVWTISSSSAPTTKPSSTTLSTVSTRPASSNVATSSQATPSNGPAISGAAYLGCYTDSTSSRALNGYYNSGNTQTLDACLAAAVAKSYKFFGVEYSGECFAGNYIASSSTSGSTNCNMPCYGNNSQICGGSSAISMFQNMKYVDGSNKPTVLNGAWSYQGCYTDSSSRSLGAYSFSNSTGMSIEMCATTCAQKGFNWMGSEYAAECYCGASAPANGAVKVADTDCAMRCAGDASEWCGAGNRLTVYSLQRS